jgi:hypothetical protein
MSSRISLTGSNSAKQAQWHCEAGLFCGQKHLAAGNAFGGLVDQTSIIKTIVLLESRSKQELVR